MFVLILAMMTLGKAELCLDNKSLRQFIDPSAKNEVLVLVFKYF